MECGGLTGSVLWVVNQRRSSATGYRLAGKLNSSQKGSDAETNIRGTEERDRETGRLPTALCFFKEFLSIIQSQLADLTVRTSK